MLAISVSLLCACMKLRGQSFLNCLFSLSNSVQLAPLMFFMDFLWIRLKSTLIDNSQVYYSHQDKPLSNLVMCQI